MTETKNFPEDPLTLIQEALRESYRQATEDLRDYAEKVRSFNQRKKALRAYLAALREFRASVIAAARERGVDLCRGDKNDLAALAKLFDQHAHPFEVGEVEYAVCIPDRVPRARVTNIELLDAETACWEERLATLGDDSQLVTIDLQNAMQKQQQTVQLMSNIAKMRDDAVKAVIQNIR